MSDTVQHQKTIYHFVPNNRRGGVQSFVRDLASTQNGARIVYTKVEGQLAAHEVSFAKFIFVLLPKILMFRDAVVFHTHGPTLTYVFCISFVFRMLTIHTVHNLAEYEAGKLRRRLYRAFYRSRLLCAVAICEAVANSFEEQYNKNVKYVIYNGIVGVEKLERPANSLLREGGIVFLARLDNQKNFDLALKVFDRVHSIRPCLPIKVFGADYGCYDNELFSSLQSRGVFRYFGETNAPLRELNGSSLLLLTSKFEGFPIVILEALNVGTHVVSTDVGGINEILDAQRLVAFSENEDDMIEEFVSKIFQAIDDESKPVLNEEFKMKNTAKKYSLCYTAEYENWRKSDE